VVVGRWFAVAGAQLCAVPFRWPKMHELRPGLRALAYGSMSKSAQHIVSTTRRQFESLTEAAERTGLSTYTLRRRIADGRLPAYRSGSRIIRVDPDDVDNLLRRIPAVIRGS